MNEKSRIKNIGAPLEKTMNYFYDDSLELVKIKRSTHVLRNAKWVVTFSEEQMKDAVKNLEKVRKQLVQQKLIGENEMIYVTQKFKYHNRLGTKKFEIGFIKQGA